jgi:signal transduction histidine kinase
VAADPAARPPPNLRPAPLVAAATLLSNRSVYGLIWVDHHLTVTGTYGRLVDFVTVGEPLTNSVPVFVGLENEIHTLKSSQGRVLDLPIASIVTATGATPKLNFTALWSADEDANLVLVSRAGQVSNTEIELSRQMRARLIAETEVKQKSELLSKANTELERANRDLEEFASIISHDLKAPMRQLRYMVEDLQSGSSGPLPVEAHERLRSVQLQSQRMSAMLSALLEYSSAGRKDEIVELVDTENLVQTIIRSMPQPAGFSIRTSGIWPAIHTLQAPLDLVLRNLIDNAIKHHDSDQGTILLHCADQSATLEIDIADDGPGIDPRHHEAVFLPFRQLNTAGQTGNGQDAGTVGQGMGQGMGLAFVKRWVEAAGGQIQLNSDPQLRRGTTVHISWPKAARAEITGK